MVCRQLLKSLLVVTINLFFLMKYKIQTFSAIFSFPSINLEWWIVSLDTCKITQRSSQPQVVTQKYKTLAIIDLHGFYLLNYLVPWLNQFEYWNPEQKYFSTSNQIQRKPMMNKIPHCHWVERKHFRRQHRKVLPPKMSNTSRLAVGLISHALFGRACLMKRL